MPKQTLSLMAGLVLMATASCASTGNQLNYPQGAAGGPTPFANGTMYRFGSVIDGYRLVKQMPDFNRNYCFTVKQRTAWGTEKHEECGILADRVGYGNCHAIRYRWQDGRKKRMYLDNPCTLDLVASHGYFSINRAGASVRRQANIIVRNNSLGPNAIVIQNDRYTPVNRGAWIGSTRPLTNDAPLTIENMGNSNPTDRDIDAHYD